MAKDSGRADELASAQLSNAVQDLHKQVARYDRADLVAGVALLEILRHETVTAFVDYLAGLVWGAKAETSATSEPLTIDDARAIRKALSIMFSRAIEARRSHGDPHDVSTAPLDRIRFRAALAGMTYRHPVTFRHWNEILWELFQPIESDVSAALGFSCDDALRAYWAIDDLVVTRITSFAQVTRRGKHRIPIDLSGVSAVFRVGATTLAQAAKISTSAASAILTTFGLAASGGPLFDGLPSSYGPTMLLPLLTVDEGAVLAYNPPLLLEAVLPTITRALQRAGPRIFERYQQQRAAFLEQKTAALLHERFHTLPLLTNLFYPNPDGGPDVEVDSVLQHDGTVYVVECKAAMLSAPARRGAPSLAEDIDGLIIDAADQTTRARRYIESGGRSFRSESGGTTTLLEPVVEIVPVCITLEYTVGAAAECRLLQESGKLKGSTPWLLSIGELMAIVDMMDRPYLLAQYIRRRLEVYCSQYNVAYAFDENDHALLFLKTGFCAFPPARGSSGEVPILSFGLMEEFNEYYDRQPNKAKKPRLNVPAEMHEILDSAASESDGASLALDLTSFSIGVLRGLSTMIREARVEWKRERLAAHYRVYIEPRAEVAVAFVWQSERGLAMRKDPTQLLLLEMRHRVKGLIVVHETPAGIRVERYRDDGAGLDRKSLAAVGAHRSRSTSGR